MSDVILFFGHGSFDTKEQPAKIAVPGGSKFCLFARHKEQIQGERMTDLSFYITRYNVEALAKQANLLAHEGFKAEMSEGRHLRRIKSGGDMVHNYRLFPPTGLTLNCDRNDEDEEKHGVTVVTTKDEKGETLEALFKKHATPGAVMMWVACRSVINGQKEDMVDGYGLPASLTTLTNTEGQTLSVLHRPENYFKA